MTTVPPPNDAASQIEADNPDSEVAEVSESETTNADGSVTETTDVKFFNQHEGKHGRLPGDYLDQRENQAAEVKRAASEDREPDLENPGTTAGTPLVTENALTHQSQAADSRGVVDDNAPVSAAPVQTLPVDNSEGTATDPTSTGVATNSPEASSDGIQDIPTEDITGAGTSNGTLDMQPVNSDLAQPETSPGATFGPGGTVGDGTTYGETATSDSANAVPAGATGDASTPGVVNSDPTNSNPAQPPTATSPVGVPPSAAS